MVELIGAGYLAYLGIRALLAANRDGGGLVADHGGPEHTGGLAAFR